MTEKGLLSSFNAKVKHRLTEIESQVSLAFTFIFDVFLINQGHGPEIKKHEWIILNIQVGC